MHRGGAGAYHLDRGLGTGRGRQGHGLLRQLRDGHKMGLAADGPRSHPNLHPLTARPCGPAHSLHNSTAAENHRVVWGGHLSANSHSPKMIVPPPPPVILIVCRG